MRNFSFIALFGLLLFISSCCKTKECKCDLEDSFLNIEAQHWIEPLAYRDVIFVDSGKIELLYQRNYKQYIYCLGEGECCTDFPFLTVDYVEHKSELEMLHVNALKNDVTFTSPDGGGLGFLNVNTNVWTTQSDVEMISFDTIYLGSQKEAVRIKNLEKRDGIAFKELVYVKQIGMVEYTDLSSVQWIKK